MANKRQIIIRIGDIPGQPVEVTKRNQRVREMIRQENELDDYLEKEFGILPLGRKRGIFVSHE